MAAYYCYVILNQSCDLDTLINSRGLMTSVTLFSVMGKLSPSSLESTFSTEVEKEVFFPLPDYILCFCFSYRPRHVLLGMLVPISCLKSSKG